MTNTKTNAMNEWLWQQEVRAYQEREDALAHAVTLPAADASFVRWQANADLAREKARIEMVRAGELPASALCR